MENSILLVIIIIFNYSQLSEARLFA